MSWTESSFGQWLLHSALGGGVLLLLTWLVMRLVRQPARRQRLGEFGMAAALVIAALSLAPAWLWVPVPGVIAPAELHSQSNSPGNSDRQNGGPLATRAESIRGASALPLDGSPLAPRAEGTPGLTAELPSLTVPAGPDHSPPVRTESLLDDKTQADQRDPWLAILGVVYATGASLILARWLLGYLGLVRFFWAATPAPPRATRLFNRMATGRARARLLAAQRLRVPLSCGLLRPTVLLPASLCNAPADRLRWIFAHELTHLERRDPWTCLLFALGQAMFFYVPWFWAVRRQVQLCQEYVADASAAAEADEHADYAEFLLSLTRAPLAPAWATGVSGHTSDLFRRIAMLLHSPFAVERRCPRLWSLATAGGLLSLAVLVAGVGLRADAAGTPPAAQAKADEDPKKDEPKKEQPAKKDAKKENKDDAKPEKKRIFNGEFDLPDLEEMLKNLPQNLDPEKLAEIRKQIEQARGEFRKRMEEMRRNMPEGMQGRFPFRGLREFAGSAMPGGGRLGVRIAPPSPVLADQLSLPRSQGLVIEAVTPDSPAGKAGLKPHDILLSFNGKPVSSNPLEFAEQIRDAKADTPVEVVVVRKGKQETVKGLTLPEMKSEQPKTRRGRGSIREFPAPPVPPGTRDGAFQTIFSGGDV